MLEGRVSVLGDSYLVGMGDGGEVLLPVTAVEMVCDDLEDAYLRKRAELRYGQLDRHLELATWCQRQGLLARAADQILVVYSLDPSNAALAAAVRMQESAAQQQRWTESRSAGEATGGLTPTGPADDGRNTEHHTELHAQPDANAAANGNANSDVPAADLAQALPPRAIEQFTSEVQPLLLNRCATNACHGGGSTATSGPKLSLQRALPGRQVSRRITHQNLVGVLPFVDRQAPERSALLVKPSQPHGGLAEPLLTDDQAAQFAALARWIRTLALPGARPVPPTLREPPPVLSQAPERSAEPVVRRIPPPETTRSEDTYQPRDPFDPEIFNREWVDEEG